ncbi:AurF N-oxygenase family protein [Gordonia phthalatica]|uniref:Aminobenzoate oxygenase n=1 Tax=Gordonia phthalatica TaxID=1136941 RepID=A0A0N9N0G7_9ACTN|nr:diiron oxygenase [Gordonia phthalatica]ALG84058.1 aminobenzoate oxygenase [Gordonia phthalatica]
MTTTDDAQAVRDGQLKIANRLLKGSTSRSYDPIVDVDFDAPLVEGKYFLPPRVISLYGTDVWESMTEEQRIELSRQEMTNILSVGIWFENLLNRALLNRLMTKDPAAATTHYSLTEMGDECRHMTMFGKTIERVGGRAYMMRGWQRAVMHVLPPIMRGTQMWVITLVGEELFDALQREIKNDPELQPMVARVMQIHVTEESRHIGFARDAIVRRGPIRSRFETLVSANVHGLAAPLFQRLFTTPEMYRRAGFDNPKQIAKIARKNPNFNASQIMSFESLSTFLIKNDLMGPFGSFMWRRAGFLK